MVGEESWGPEGDVILIEASKIPLGMSTENQGGEEGTTAKARQQLLDQGFTDDEIEDMLESDYEIDSDEPSEGKPYPTEHACRLNDPGKYDEFARVNCFKKSNNKCIDYVFGVKGGKSEVQALRYKKSVWAITDARKHCDGRGGKFEAG